MYVCVCLCVCMYVRVCVCVCVCVWCVYSLSHSLDNIHMQIATIGPTTYEDAISGLIVTIYLLVCFPAIHARLGEAMMEVKPANSRQDL